MNRSRTAPGTQSGTPLYQMVKQHILSLIANGQWDEDRRLPSEHELVAALGVSRMTVNRALRELASAEASFAEVALGLHYGTKLKLNSGKKNMKTMMITMNPILFSIML